VQRAAADAAVASASVRVCGGRVLLLLEARQALSVCLRCWQLQGWWPDPVGALMGAFPRASAAGDEYAREDAAAQKEVRCRPKLWLHVRTKRPKALLSGTSCCLASLDLASAGPFVNWLAIQVLLVLAGALHETFITLHCTVS
jgi:hypothetical protein